MILQALTRYYDRADTLAPEGWIRRGVDYVLTLDAKGLCTGLDAIWVQHGGKRRSADVLVTAVGKQALKHTNSGKDANLLWDNASFVLGTGNKGALKLQSFLEAIDRWFSGLRDEGVEAVRMFCSSIQRGEVLASDLVGSFGVQEEFEKRDPVIVFRLNTDIEYVHTRSSVRECYEQSRLAPNEKSVRGTCLVTGSTDVPIALNETVIKGVLGGQTAGANILSFNERAFESYGKRDRKGENAPISVRASFAYTTALNHLLSRESRQRIQVGDASTIFWAEEEHDLESAIPDLFSDPPKDDPDRNVRAVEALYAAVQTGRFSVGATTTRFHVLGLAPNAARISVRFWEMATASELATRIKRHFDDLAVVHAEFEPNHLSLFRVLSGVALQHKIDNVPPNLGGEVMRAILEGLPYPVRLLNLAVVRCRAEQKVTYARAAAIKACLNRFIRSRNTEEKEFLPMLDPSNVNAAYRLGRLFATLEKIQEEASPGLNATIRDRYYGAASSTPVSVFTTLLRLKNHHIAKLSPGRAVQMERLFGEILGGLDDFPRNLPLPEQGRFALGYYHQRQAFFNRSEPKNEGES